jgi:MurNAc alpha-1-phosphate uridylyltransferase
VFSGVQLLSKALFDGEPVEPFSLNRVYDKALKEKRLFGAVHQGLWFHVGTPEAVIATEALLERG